MNILQAHDSGILIYTENWDAMQERNPAAPRLFENVVHLKSKKTTIYDAKKQTHTM